MTEATTNLTCAGIDGGPAFGDDEAGARSVVDRGPRISALRLVAGRPGHRVPLRPIAFALAIDGVLHDLHARGGGRGKSGKRR